MSKFIDADALIARLRKSAESNPGTIASTLCELVCGDIELEPEAVIRCKDCKYQSKGHNESDAWNTCKYRSWLYIPTDDDHYCGHGEKR